MLHSAIVGLAIIIKAMLLWCSGALSAKLVTLLVYKKDIDSLDINLPFITLALFYVLSHCI